MFQSSSLVNFKPRCHHDPPERFETKIVKPLLLNLAGSHLYGEAKLRPIVPVVLVVQESK